MGFSKHYYYLEKFIDDDKKRIKTSKTSAEGIIILVYVLAILYTIMYSSMIDLRSLDPFQAAYLCLAISIPVSLWLYYSSSNNSHKDNDSVPDAPGGVPLLGHALLYKTNPTGCIRQLESTTDSKLFRINLAGRRMIVLGSDPQAMQFLAQQPESTLSSRRAVAELGFEYVLGSLNVYEGTDWHKRILKNYISHGSTFLPNMFQALQKALEEELRVLPNHPTTADSRHDTNMVQVPDVFAFTRRCVLRATLDEFVTPQLLENDALLLTDLMVFQDRLEDAIAQSAVLPRWLALPLFLWPVQSLRYGLQSRMSRSLESILPEERNNASTKATTGQHGKIGPWLQTYLEEKTLPTVAAEHLIGLIFAAHKNPSIGASQSLCFFRTELNKDQQNEGAVEAQRVCDLFASHLECDEQITNASLGLLSEGLLQAKTLRACVLETNRLVAHTLGAVRYVNKPLQVTTTTADKKERTYIINPGETVSFAHHTVHMEPSLWGKDAADFRLARPEWDQDSNNVTENGDLGVPVDQYKYTAFSNGMHKCPGERIAMAMMEIMLALLVQKEAHFVVDKLPPLSFERATLAQRDGPCCIRLKR